jgi:cytochrome c oxidase subunit III
MNAAAQPLPAPRPVPRTFGMWVFIASELLFFGALLAAYLAGRVHWPEGFGAASRHTHVVLGTLNTAVLLTSSALIALAVACDRHHAHRRWTARLLWGTAALGLVFLAIKGYEYVQEWHEHLFPGPAFALPEPGAQLFFMLYFLMTALHAVHLVCGIAAVVVFARATGARRAWADPERLDAVALYWHFVDVVWIFLYPFLYLVERHA